MEQHDFSHLLPPTYENIIKEYLKEDMPSFDIGGFVVGDVQETAHILCKQDGYLVGVPFINTLFKILNCQIEWLVKEGTYIKVTNEKGEFNKHIVAKVYGPCNKILLGERTALNILSRASGVGTLGYYFNELAKKNNWKGVIAGTRKTTPGFRLIEKYALMVSGMNTHRFDLSQMVMLKDNHIWSCGNISNAIHKAKIASGFSAKIEIECQNLEEALEAAAAGGDIVMLDNFNNTNDLEKAAKQIKTKYPNILVESSGGINKKNIENYFLPDVDIISLGLLTHGYPCIDFSLKIQKKTNVIKSIITSSTSTTHEKKRKSTT